MRKGKGPHRLVRHPGSDDQSCLLDFDPPTPCADSSYGRFRGGHWFNGRSFENKAGYAVGNV